MVMKKKVVFTGIFLIIFLVACQSAESKEVLEYHNNYVENIQEKMNDVERINEEIWDSDSDDIILNAIDVELYPLLEQMKVYMDQQDPKYKETKGYNDLRLTAFNMFYDSMNLEMESFRGVLIDELSEEEVEKILKKSKNKFEEAKILEQKANKKIEKLSEKYKFDCENNNLNT